MITQKLYRNGNSVVVSIPKEYLNELNLSEDSQVIVKKQGDNLIVSRAEQPSNAQVDAKFAQMVDEFMNEHKDVLEELSKR
jgi:putative addiction module antidote